MGAFPKGWTHLAFDSLDSTNSEAMRRAQPGIGTAGAAHGLWITAAEQVAGRGRRGRVWQSPPGNLIASVLLRPQVSAVRAGELSLVTAVALGDALAAIAPAVPVSFKWPNDVQVKGAKLAGILLESAATGPAPEWVVAGIGVNVAGCPDDLPYPATSLAEQGADVSAGQLFAQLAAAFANWYDRWQAEGFAPVRAAWMARAAQLGQAITVQRGSDQATGRFDGIDAAGGLILRTETGPVTITSGEVL